MSTRSNIAIKRKNGSIESIYCHFDGYLDYNGYILLNYYKDINKINELIDLGDISSLDKEVNPTEEHSFDKPQKGVTVTYGRDRGESGVSKQVFESLDSYKKYLKGSWCEFVYIYDESYNKWLYTTLYGDMTIRELTEEEIDKERN